MFLLVTETSHMLFLLRRTLFLPLVTQGLYHLQGNGPNSEIPFPASPVSNQLTLATFSWRNSRLSSWCLSELE